VPVLEESIRRIAKKVAEGKKNENNLVSEVSSIKSDVIALMREN